MRLFGSNPESADNNESENGGLKNLLRNLRIQQIRKQIQETYGDQTTPEELTDEYIGDIVDHEDEIKGKLPDDVDIPPVPGTDNPEKDYSVYILSRVKYRFDHFIFGILHQQIL
jgi:hypothetical protein